MKWSGAFFYVLLFMFACSEDPVSNPSLSLPSIAFNSESKIDVMENDPTIIAIPLKLSESQEVATSVTFEVIEQDVVEGSDFTILTENPVIIAAGSTEGKISIQINDNSIVQPEDRKIYLRIRSIDPSTIQIKVPKEVVITIKEDDCAANVPNVKLWIGDISVQNENDLTQATGLESSGGVCSGSFKVKGKFVGSENPESTVLVTLTQSATDKTKGTAKVARTKLFDFTSEYEFEASGTYDESTKKIIMDYSFYDLLDSSNNFSSTLTITTL